VPFAELACTAFAPAPSTVSTGVAFAGTPAIFTPSLTGEELVTATNGLFTDTLFEAEEIEGRFVVSAKTEGATVATKVAGVFDDGISVPSTAGATGVFATSLPVDTLTFR
jgi:hypothetical protein